MNKLALALFAVTGFGAATVALAPLASALPSAGSAQHTVNTMEARGHSVTWNQVGGAPLNRCVVITAPPGRDVTPPTTSREGRGPVQQKLPSTSYIIDVTC
jgi:hypothetical protein